MAKNTNFKNYIIMNSQALQNLSNNNNNLQLYYKLNIKSNFLGENLSTENLKVKKNFAR